MFDERLVRNQDYELNIRLREAGFDVWFDPQLSVGYRPRGSWTALAAQYYQYGYWKSVVLRMHPRSARARQLVPPVAIAGLALTTLGGIRRRLLLAPMLSYVALAAIVTRRAAGLGAVLGLHIPWAAGFVRGLLRPIRSSAAGRVE